MEFKTTKATTVAGINKAVAALEVGERLRVVGVPNEVYHATDGIGSTKMKAAHKTMLDYWVAVNEPEEVSATTQKAFDMGSAVHCLVLEPHLFDDEFIMQPESIKTRRGKEWDAFKAKAEGKIILSPSDHFEAAAMAYSVHKLAGKFFVDGEAEISYWLKDESGLILKARSDWEAKDYCIDLKTTRDDTPEFFTNTVKKQYAVQDALYRRVIGCADMIYIGVAKSKPYHVFAAMQGDDVRQKADNTLQDVINNLAFASAVNEWEGYKVDLTITELKPWEAE